MTWRCFLWSWHSSPGSTLQALSLLSYRCYQINSGLDTTFKEKLTHRLIIEEFFWENTSFKEKHKHLRETQDLRRNTNFLGETQADTHHNQLSEYRSRNTNFLGKTQASTCRRWRSRWFLLPRQLFVWTLQRCIHALEGKKGVKVEHVEDNSCKYCVGQLVKVF